MGHDNLYTRFFMNFAKYIFPVEVEVQTVPHFKVPINAKVEPLRLDSAGLFTF